MKLKTTLVLIIGALILALGGCAKTSTTHPPPLSSSADNIFYAVYYGRLDEPAVAGVNWSKYKLIIIKSLKEDEYHNLTNPGAYKKLQKIRGMGVEVFIYLNIGRPSENSYVEAEDKESWLKEAKKNISLYLLYADGIFLDRAGGVKEESLVSGLKKLISFIHARHGQVIISDLTDTFQAQIENPQTKQFLAADYYLLENCWTSYTGSPQNPYYQYQNVPEQIRIINYGKGNKAKILGLNWGNPDDAENFKYVYLLSKTLGLAGLCYTNPAWQHESGIFQPSFTYRLGKPLGTYEERDGLYLRKYKNGTISVDVNAHWGRITR